MYRAAIVGCGRIAGDWDQSIQSDRPLTHAGAYQACPDTELVTVCDIDPERAREFAERWNVESYYTGISEMLDCEKIDIVSLCVPTPLHGAALSQVCQYEVPAVFCEKPLSTDLDEAARMVETARGRVVAVNYFRRWNSSLSELQAELSDGGLGRPVRAIVRYTKGLLNNGSHLIDLARWFFGEPVRVESLGTISGDLDPGVDFRLGFDNGLEVLFQHIPAVDFVFIDVDIITDRARVVIEQRGQLLVRYKVTPDGTYPLNIISRDYVKETQWDRCLSNAVRDIVACLESGGQPRCTMEDGLRAMEVSFRLIVAGRNYTS